MNCYASPSRRLWMHRLQRHRFFFTPQSRLHSIGSSSPSSALLRNSLLALTFLTSGWLARDILPPYFKSPSSFYVSSKEYGKYGSPDDFDRCTRELKATFPDDGYVTTEEKDLLEHGFSHYDYHPGVLHSVVVYPRSTADVVKIVKLATKYKVPVIPYSAGTSLEGHTRGHKTGGICVDMLGMDKILAINEKDGDLICQPGARWMDINETLRDKGLFFPLDPAPGASIGGMLATGCSGTNAVRYGTAKAEWFINATVVLPSGEVIKTRRRSRKSAAGWDLTKLFIGAEGTLGIVTEVTIRLAPLLPTNVAIVQFPDVRKATEAVREILGKGIGIQCVELVDTAAIQAINAYGMSKKKREVKDSLFIKFQGYSKENIIESAKVTKQICAAHGGTSFSLAASEEEAHNTWMDRKNILFAGLNLIPGARGWSTDVCVPVSRLPDLVYETKADLEGIGLKSMICGHVGDGNFHALILFENDDQLEIARDAVHRMVERAIAMDGTCTGEHGVGIGKKGYLVEELGPGTVELMKHIKRSVDPLGLFNPDKLYPDERDTSDSHKH